MLPRAGGTVRAHLTGAELSSADRRDLDFHASDLYAGAAPDARRDWDFRSLHTWRVQGAPSCVAYATIAQIQTLAIAQGRPIPALSAEYTWNGARRYGMAPIPGAGVAITGSSVRLNYKHARDRGVISEDAFPDSPENHDRVPPAHVWQAKVHAKVARYHRIRGEKNPEQLRDGIVAAFSLLEDGGRCSMPLAVQMVGSGYDATPDGAAWDGAMGEAWGYHAQAIVAYRAVDDCIGYASSWGARTYWVPIEILADIGAEFWCVDGLEVMP